MNPSKPRQMTFDNLGKMSIATETLYFNKEKIIHLLERINALDDSNALKNEVNKLKRIVLYPENDQEGLLNIVANGDVVSLRSQVLIAELDQILEAYTIERAKYYLKRLRQGVRNIKTTKINDINLLRWKEYDEIITDSLWFLAKRDASGAHRGWYWGNFIPQIPHQMMLRYTKKGEWVLDTFVGSGTTLIECRRLGRNGIGIELNPKTAQKAEELVDKEPNKYNVDSEVVTGDSRRIDIGTVLAKHGIKQVQLLIMHPPYFDIIPFSDDDRDLSNAKTVGGFLEMFGEVVSNATPYLEKDRYLAVVIGDKYSKGEWIPLGFLCMSEVLKKGYMLKSIIVKNFEETRAKRNQKELWRYRALAGGFYVFKHEYVLLFKKVSGH